MHTYYSYLLVEEEVVEFSFLARLRAKKTGEELEFLKDTGTGNGKWWSIGRGKE